MRLKAPYIARTASAGQFLHIRCGGSTNPLLRRPISIHRKGADYAEILYNVVGKGTDILSRKKAGDKLDIIGPLGNGFKVYRNDRSIKMLVAGGMGVAPLLGLGEELSRAIKGKKKFIVVLGAKTQKHVLCESEFKKLGAEIYVATEDGSKGKKALATELASDIIKSGKYKRQEVCIYAAGPMPMARALCRMMQGCSLESQISLEGRMACGLGACLGCAINTQSGYKRVCKDGPVFPLCDVLFDNL